MRFDDMLATVLAQSASDSRALILQWRQLVDRLAQGRDAEPSPLADAAYLRLAEARSAVPVGDRMAAARSLAGHRLPPRLVALFAADHAAVAAPVIRGARLGADEWIALLPQLGPTARALLRHRDDLDPAVMRALEGFGPSDLVIEGEVGPPPARFDEPSGSQIRELVARIEAFRQQRDLKSAENPPAIEAEPAESFRWECGGDGVLNWIEGAERGALIGQSIASPAAEGADGVEDTAAAAFVARRGFRDLRLRLANGDSWRISGVPLFEGASGRFLGFRGTGRCPRSDEAGSDDLAGLMGTGIPAVALREMVHELRTPLNAIIGFAELIDGQFLGPAGQRQRARAGDIRDQAHRLVRALEDLDLAARLDDGRVELGAGSVDMEGLVHRLHDAFAAMAAERGVMLRVVLASGLSPAAIDPDAAERLVSRLLHAAIGVAASGEAVGVRLAREEQGGSGLVLSVDRPQSIRGPGAAAMLDPGYAHAAPVSGAPALGLGFVLRLVRNLARSAGGDLAIGADAFALSLPTKERSELPSGQRR